MSDSNHLPVRATALQKSTGRNLETSQPWAPSEKANLAQIMGRVCALQKAYGKTSAELETMVEGFAWALQDYDPQLVVRAIGKFLLQSRDIPTPFDIREIIDPIKKPWEPDKIYYLGLKRLLEKEGQYAISTDELAYVRKYEDHARMVAAEGIEPPISGL